MRKSPLSAVQRLHSSNEAKDIQPIGWAFGAIHFGVGVLFKYCSLLLSLKNAILKMERTGKKREGRKEDWRKKRRRKHDLESLLLSTCNRLLYLKWHRIGVFPLSLTNADKWPPAPGSPFVSIMDMDASSCRSSRGGLKSARPCTDSEKFGTVQLYEITPLGVRVISWETENKV